jgi:hypothetical protein
MTSCAESGALQFVHAAGNDFQRVNVQAGIRLVEDGELRFEHGHLENFARFFSPPEKPSFTERLSKSSLSSSSLILSFTNPEIQSRRVPAGLWICGFRSARP